jgi:hypothetical protein
MNRASSSAFNRPRIDRSGQMKTFSILACGAVAAALLGGCASGYGEGVTSVGFGYDGFYDDYYGPFVDGYWNHNTFFYADGRGHWLRDRGHHFRRDAAPGFHSFHGHGHGPDRHRH